MISITVEVQYCFLSKPQLLVITEVTSNVKKDTVLNFALCSLETMEVKHFVKMFNIKIEFCSYTHTFDGMQNAPVKNFYCQKIPWAPV